MKKVTWGFALVVGLSLLLMPVPSQAQPPMHLLDLGAVGCNWGVLTMMAIVHEDFDQGGHASSQGNPRVGLPNVAVDLLGSDGPDLEAVCQFVGCEVFPDDPICRE